MIVERNVFYAKYGQGDALVAVIRDFVNGVGKDMLPSKPRLLTDATGEMFQVIWEIEYTDLRQLAEIRAQEEASFGSKEFQDWFAKMQPLVERGERQLYQVVDL